MFFSVSTWLPAFAATLAIEAPIVAMGIGRKGHQVVQVAAVFVAGNLGTHLAIWYLGTQLLLPGTLEFVVLAESWAITAEALLYWAALPGISPRGAFLTAIVANTASFFVGLWWLG